MLPDPDRSADATGEHHPPRRHRRLHHDLNVLGDGVEQARQDPVLPLALVGEVGHVGLENDWAPTRERRRLGHAGRELSRLLHGHVEALDELAQEVAGTLGAARVLAEDLDPSRAQLQHRETMAPDGDHRRRGVAEEEPLARRLRLLGRDSNQRHLAAEPAAHCGAVDPLPVPSCEEPEKRLAWILMVIGNLAPGPTKSSVLRAELGELDGLGADVDADVAGHVRSLADCAPQRSRGSADLLTVKRGALFLPLFRSQPGRPTQRIVVGSRYRRRASGPPKEHEVRSRPELRRSPP